MSDAVENKGFEGSFEMSDDVGYSSPAQEPGGSGGQSMTPTSAGAKSKLDNLSKDDLIKFAKKQMAAIQKMKSKCAELEKDVETLKQQSNPSNGSDDSLIQELTERMDALLLEKAETQQSLAMSRKDVEKTKQQAKDDAAALEDEFNCVREELQNKIRSLEILIEESNNKQGAQEGHFQALLHEREENDRARESEREKERLEEQRILTEKEEAQRKLEEKVESLQAELEVIREKCTQSMSELQESHQRELTKTQQEVENLKEELVQRNMQHEEELKAVEDDFEMERERLLLLQDELTEQLALKESHLQDVQEEEEDPAQSSGITRMLELSGYSQGNFSHVNGEESETGKLKVALEELQAHNTMLQDELTLLNNVKSELEAELERVKDESLVEKEELEFKINEMQMNREGVAADMGQTPDTDKDADVVTVTDTEGIQQTSEEHKLDEEVSPSVANHVKESTVDLEESAMLKSQCETLTKERDTALEDCQQLRDILQSFETELGEKTNEFVLQYSAMKEQGANTLRELQEQIDQLNQERDGLLSKISDISDEKKAVVDDVEDLKKKLESSLAEIQKYQASLEEQSALSSELKQSVEELTNQNEEVLSQLQMKEHTTEDLKEMLDTMTEERDKMKSLLELKEEELSRLNDERASEMERLAFEKEALLQRDEAEKEAMRIEKENQDEAQKHKEEMENLARSHKEELEGLQEAVRNISTEKTDLQVKLKETLDQLSSTEDEKTRLDLKITALVTDLEVKTSEKQDLDVKVNVLTEEVEQARNAVQALEENHSDSLKEVEELRTRQDELEKERNLLRSKLEEAKSERDLQVQNELQVHTRNMEEEKNLLKSHLEEVVRDVEGLQKDLEEMKSMNEKICAENEALQTQASLMAQEREEKEKEDHERRNLEGELTEKESLISQLKDELSALQESASSSASPEQNEDHEMTNKITLLEKENKEKDERMHKIKAVAVKAKKELDISKKEIVVLKEEIVSLKAERVKVNSSMKDIILGAEGYKNLQIDYDTQTEQLDKEREKVEAGEKQIADLTKRLGAAVTQVDLLTSEKEDLLAGMETVRSSLKQLELQNQELQRQSASFERDLVAEKSMKEQKLKELSAASKEVDDLTAQLLKQQQQSQQAAQELEQLRKEAQQSSLMDMEMADYERLVRDLNTKLSEKDEHTEELKAQINQQSLKEETLKKEIESLKSQLDQEEEKTSKMKQLLVKSKKDLADTKKQESTLMVMQASLKGELEANQQHLESSKIEVSELMAESHRLQEQLRAATEQRQRTSSSLQQRITILQQERDAAKAELISTTEEFESYKVRVHNVLKQQKSKKNGESEGDVGKLERERMTSQVEQLRSRLAESQQNLQSSTVELLQLQNEHDTLLERHNKILQENVSKEAELRERLLSVQSENVSLQSDLAQAQADMSSQIEVQRQTYREQLRKMQDDHRATVETLQGQLTRVEEQLFNMQSQNSSMSVQSSRKSYTSDSHRRSKDQSQTSQGLMTLGDLQCMAREEGEGMETTESESPSPASMTLPSLEKLLTSPDPKQEPFVWTVEPTKEELSQQLSTATRSMEHMNGLLHETEATNAVLMEQITLLKSEVRRLERNQEREKSVANLEYLKNVLLQFIFLRSGSERQALLPVMQTMLQLSPEEKNKLAAIAQGEEEGSAARSSGWTSYLHSWSGIR
ncbi:GRIP and coiled-coil domain-containing protein 2 [Neosynchiropus ocellatus]